MTHLVIPRMETTRNIPLINIRGGVTSQTICNGTRYVSCICGGSQNRQRRFEVTDERINSFLEGCCSGDFLFVRSLDRHTDGQLLEIPKLQRETRNNWARGRGGRMELPSSVSDRGNHSFRCLRNRLLLRCPMPFSSLVDKS